MERHHGQKRNYMVQSCWGEIHSFHPQKGVKLKLLKKYYKWPQKILEQYLANTYPLTNHWHVCLISTISHNKPKSDFFFNQVHFHICHIIMLEVIMGVLDKFYQGRNTLKLVRRPILSDEIAKYSNPNNRGKRACIRQLEWLMQWCIWFPYI